MSHDNQTDLPPLVADLAPDGYPALKATEAPRPFARPASPLGSRAAAPKPDTLPPPDRAARAGRASAASGALLIHGDVVDDVMTPQEIERLFAAQEGKGEAPAALGPSRREEKGAPPASAAPRRPGPAPTPGCVLGPVPAPGSPVALYVAPPFRSAAGPARREAAQGPGPGSSGRGPSPGGDRFDEIRVRWSDDGEPDSPRSQGRRSELGDEVLSQLKEVVLELAALRTSIEKLTKVVAATGRTAAMLARGGLAPEPALQPSPPPTQPTQAPAEEGAPERSGRA